MREVNLNKTIIQKPVNLPALSDHLCDLHRRLDKAIDDTVGTVCLAEDFPQPEAKRIKLQVKAILLSRAQEESCPIAFRYACNRGWPGFELRLAAE